MPDLDQLLKSRGEAHELGAFVTAACFTANSAPAFALGDGTIQFKATAWTSIPAHKGAILSMAPAPVGGGVITGGDDGKLLTITPGDEIRELASFGSKWVEHVATFAGKSPLIAASAGKIIHLFDAAGVKLREFPHPSTVTGIAIEPKGKRLAASHYNGASLWFTGSNAQTPRLLEWKGSHIGVALHPGGEALVTAMQESALHGWTLPEGKHMRMAGYPAKTESLGFTKSGRWLATAGADTLVLWPFFGGGPMGKAPNELGASEGIIKRIVCHPEREMVAIGFDTGLATLIDINAEKILPLCAPGRGAVTALAWNHSGSHLALGTETGFAAVLDFSTG